MLNKILCSLFTLIIVFIGSVEITEAQTTSTKIAKLLDSTEWIAIDKSSNVTFQKKNWQGSTDLSFRYKLLVQEGIVYILVQVEDNKVFLQDGKTIFSDHIEFWLADPLLTKEFQSNQLEIKDGLAEFQDRLKSPEEDKPTKEAIRAFLPEMTKTLKSYSQEKYYQQLVFNRNFVSLNPKNLELNKGLFYEYKVIPKGYQFAASIPLYKACSFKTKEIKELAYLIDVIDIDLANTNKQKSLMSSSDKRVYDQPDTFSSLKLSTPYFLPLPMLERAKAEVCPTGYYNLQGGEYKYFSQDYLQYSGYYGADVYSFVGFYLEMQLNKKDNIENTNLYAYENVLLLVQGDKYQIVDLHEKIDGIGEITQKFIQTSVKNKKIFILARYDGCTKWPPSNSNCGGGTESNLVWIKLGSDLKVEEIRSELVDSCRNAIVFVDESDDNGKVMMTFESFRTELETCITYDKNNIEEGFSVSTSPIKNK